MANPWLRLYAEFAHDPKVQMMSEAMQRRYIMLMCMRCSNDLVTLHDDEVTFHLRISEQDWAETKALFIKKGFIDSKLNLLNWEKRQFKIDSSSSSAERVAKHRAKKKSGIGNAVTPDVTLHETQSNALEQIQNRTDTEKNKEPNGSVGSADDAGSENETADEAQVLSGDKNDGYNPGHTGEKQQQGHKHLHSQSSEESQDGDAFPPCPVDKIVGLYHEQLPELPSVKLLNDKRKRALRKIWRWVLTSKKSDGQPRATTAEEACAWLRGYFHRATKNDFLMGRGQRSAEHAGWQCDLDFLLTDNGMKHVIEKTKGGAA
ncbi:hypothetical protein SR914_25440 [Comamonas testosteroni]|uniref:Uncharacterized protein n=1 Tax=Comamonas testosteroni (strain DSM 14576 / KF-1) TaxID=399795 RepID=B7X1R6_COMTK|nr:hypothetical protein [Comamonas testosteroni]EED68359.1 hypothetical protein CtesDRAFT_PD3306 [Comamonas testosteroni KF-1]EED68422.1 hypothetical protein CtesDRAFT_PD3369 [Comamonas testosteroni KF-1]WQG66454.1 hypothetical protein SR914_25440 [Comamonas testosteroni]